MIDSMAAGGTPRIVVAEDDTLIRMLVVEVLTDAGFNVLEADHAAEALSILEGDAANIHVLFTDVDMPGAMDGLGLAEHARQHWPWIGILVTSGKPSVMRDTLGAAAQFLPKPYNPEDLPVRLRGLISP